MDDDPEIPGYDPELSQIIRLAERLAGVVTEPRPDWCAIARDAADLTRRAQDRCDCDRMDKTIA